eukprot:Clim_evm32s218 gene=Clim_evmTU32s218
MNGDQLYGLDHLPNTQLESGSVNSNFTNNTDNIPDTKQKEAQPNNKGLFDYNELHLLDDDLVVPDGLQSNELSRASHSSQHQAALTAAATGSSALNPGSAGSTSTKDSTTAVPVPFHQLHGHRASATAASGHHSSSQLLDIAGGHPGNGNNRGPNEDDNNMGTFAHRHSTGGFGEHPNSGHYAYSHLPFGENMMWEHGSRDTIESDINSILAGDIFGGNANEHSEQMHEYAYNDNNLFHEHPAAQQQHGGAGGPLSNLGHHASAAAQAAAAASAAGESHDVKAAIAAGQLQPSVVTVGSPTEASAGMDDDVGMVAPAMKKRRGRPPKSAAAQAAAAAVGAATTSIPGGMKPKKKWTRRKQPNLTEEEKQRIAAEKARRKAIKMEKDRVAARLARARKKEYISNLQKELEDTRSALEKRDQTIKQLNAKVMALQRKVKEVEVTASRRRSGSKS